MKESTPMMEQYFRIKRDYKDCLLFFRLGDFYELFYQDAHTASRELGLTLTSRDAGNKERAPMCGIPHHSSDKHIVKLIEKGFKVAICDQTEDPKYAKGIVKREVVRVITPGTVIDIDMLDNAKNNYIMAIYSDKKSKGIACADVSTGDFFAYAAKNEDNENFNLRNEIALFSPSEIITNESFNYEKENFSDFNILTTKFSEWAFDYDNAYEKLCKHFKVLNLNGFGFDKPSDKYAIRAAGALLEYLSETQKNSLGHIMSLKSHEKETFMILDNYSMRNLELVETIREKKKKGSLLWAIDDTKTAMGARMIRKWLSQPLLKIDEINARLSAVEEAKQDLIFCAELKDFFCNIQDIERILTRIVYKKATARDLASLKNSIRHLPEIHSLLADKKSGLFQYFHDNMDQLTDIFQLIDDIIVENPPALLKDEGMIKDGYNEELDSYREAKDKGALWIDEMEQKERQATGIKNLKIKSNKSSVYSIEIPNSNKIAVPSRFIKRQTLKNSERYITDELKKIEDKIISAGDRILQLEREIFDNLCDLVANNLGRIKTTANILATIDVIVSLAVVAEKNNYVRPKITNSDVVDIKKGRHPVIELMIESAFAENDTYLDERENCLSIITGPNMAGKSTFMRQTALICIMAQMGSFVPAESASISIIDRVFTRIGASDDIAAGQSTFMVEMTEVANIIHNATQKSLLILDEIGRGTSTFDGLSIAWSVLERIVRNIRAKTLFATHYHELTELENKIEGVVNYRILVKEDGDDILFLHKIVRGSADNSYGIQVAKLAGLPEEVIQRAKVILGELNKADIVGNKLTLEALMGYNDTVASNGFEVDTINPIKYGSEAIKGGKFLVKDNTTEKPSVSS